MEYNSLQIGCVISLGISVKLISPNIQHYSFQDQVIHVGISLVGCDTNSTRLLLNDEGQYKHR